MINFRNTEQTRCMDWENWDNGLPGAYVFMEMTENTGGSPTK